MNQVLVAAVIFIFTYVLISAKNLPGVKLERGVSALIGGALMILFGIVSLTDALDFINFNVIFLLLGMMMLVAGLEFTGFFQIVSNFLMKHAKTRVRLLAYVMVICAALSAIALNDAVVLIFTPIVIKCCRRMGCNPIPYLVGVMFSANIGSLATSVGNPQNAYISTEAGISFLGFSMHTLPLALVCLPIAFALIYLIFRKKLVQGGESHDADDWTEVDRKRLYAVLTVAVGAFAGFIISDHIGVPLYVIAMTAGLLALAIVMTKSPKNVVWVAKKVDWMILLFFIGLFMLMGGVVQSGLLADIASVFPGFGPGETPSLLGLSAFSALLSNLVSNVPAVVLIGGMLPQGNELLWITLAASSTLAGNATLIGSAANVIVSERSEDYGVTFNFWRFAAVGIPIATVTILVSVGLLSLLY